MATWDELIGRIRQMFRPGVTLGPPRRVEIDRRVLYGGSPVRRGPPLVIPSRQDPLWVEKGWRRNGRNQCTGHYHAAGRQWRGLIEVPYPGSYQAYIWDPPLDALWQRTDHGPCFQPDGGGGRYRVHFRHMPASLDHAIIAIEAVLGEAFGARSR